MWQKSERIRRRRMTRISGGDDLAYVISPPFFLLITLEWRPTIAAAVVPLAVIAVAVMRFGFGRALLFFDGRYFQNRSEAIAHGRCDFSCSWPGFGLLLRPLLRTVVVALLLGAF